MTCLLLMINICMLVCGQVLWKIGMSKIDFQMSFKGMVRVLFNPCIFSGAIIYVLATAIWLYLLSKEQLSRIYPLQSLCYVAGAFAGIVIFKESLTMQKALGLLLILAGAVLVGMK